MKIKPPPAKMPLAEVEGALAYPPNNALLGSSSIRVPLPFGLWVYNAFVNKREDWEMDFRQAGC